MGNDIDVMIHVDFKSDAQCLYFSGIKSAILQTLRELIFELIENDSKGQRQIPKNSIRDEALTSAYITKIKKITRENLDMWSVYSISQNIDIMIVHTLNRQYRFSVDSFCIDLFNSTAYSLYPDYKLAHEDMKKKVIRVLEPEAVYGGCFLDYGLL